MDPSIVKQIVKAREKSGLSQSELALLCGWSRQHQFAIEKRKTKLSIDGMIKIAKALGVFPGAFFMGES